MVVVVLPTLREQTLALGQNVTPTNQRLPLAKGLQGATNFCLGEQRANHIRHHDSEVVDRVAGQQKVGRVVDTDVSLLVPPSGKG